MCSEFLYCVHDLITLMSWLFYDGSTSLAFSGCMLENKSKHGVSTDGAPAYCGHCVWELLNDVYLWRQFGYGGPLRWPSKFLDLNPVDYFYGDMWRKMSNFGGGVWRTLAVLNDDTVQLVGNNWLTSLFLH